MASWLTAQTNSVAFFHLGDEEKVLAATLEQVFPVGLFFGPGLTQQGGYPSLNSGEARNRCFQGYYSGELGDYLGEGFFLIRQFFLGASGSAAKHQDKQPFR